MTKLKITKISRSILIVFSCFLIFWQQEILAQSGEPKAEIRKAYENLKQTSWRLTLVIDGDTADDTQLPLSLRTFSYEHAPPDKYRIVSPGMPIAFLGSQNAAFVIIGQKAYVKRGNFDWEPSTEKIQPESRISAGNYEQLLRANFRLTGTDVLNNLKANVYFHEETETMSDDDNSRPSTKKAVQLKRTVTYWIGQTNGLLLKFELKDMEDKNGVFQLTQSITESYEYDKNIRIEPPIIKNIKR